MQVVAAKEFVAKEYQKIAVDFMLENKRCALFGGMGTGKTVAGLSVVELLQFTGSGDPVLVLGPKRVAQRVWPREAAKWKHLEHMHIAPIMGDARARTNVLRQRANIFTLNYEQIPWLVDVFAGRPWPFRTVIADESTRLKGFRMNQGGQRARALSLIVRHTDRWINLTGTPAPNGLKDLWGQMWFVDQGRRLGRTFTAFMERWFSTGYDGVVKPTKSAEREIYAAIEDITLAIRAKDWFDLKEPIVNVVNVQLPPAVMKQYKELENELFTQLACGTEVEVFNAAARTNKCLQFASGAVYTEHPSWAPVHDEKLDALESIVEEAGGAPLLVAYEFQSDKHRILDKFKNAVDISTPKGFDAFMAGRYQLGVAHPKSMGHGVDGLQDVCNHVVFFGHTWDLELHQQIIERVGATRQAQSGLDRPVYVTSIVADGTLDETVLERHESKREVQDLLMEAMSRRTNE